MGLGLVKSFSIFNLEEKEKKEKEEGKKLQLWALERLWDFEV